MSKYIQIENGRLFRPDAAVEWRRSETGFILWDLTQAVAVDANHEGAISEVAAQALELGRLGTGEGNSLFENPSLCRQIFGWLSEEEEFFLEGHFSGLKQAQGLDVACGFGRLMFPLIAKGFNIVGVDESLPCIIECSEKLNSIGRGRVTRASIEEFIEPAAFSFAYAAMNSLRYLQTKVAFFRHMTAMTKNLVRDSPYLICISICKTPQLHHEQNWTFRYLEKDFRISWSRVDYCFLTEQIVEYVNITSIDTGESIYSESQKQAHFSVNFLRNFFEKEKNNWFWESTYNTRYEKLDLQEEDVPGTFWLLIRRR